MATKLGIYNGALLLLGQRLLLTDTEDRPSRYDLDHLYNSGGLDHCLAMVKPRFASKVTSLTGVTPTATTGYTYQVDLPDAGFLELVDVFADGKLEQPIKKFYREDDFILCDFQTVWVRYIRDFATVGLTNMPQSFANVVSAYFAREMANKYDPDEYEVIQKELDSRIDLVENLRDDDESIGQSLTPTVLTNDWRYIYNDALLMLGKEPIASNTDDSPRKNKLDHARTAHLIEAVLEDTAWGFGRVTQQLNYDPAVVPEFGYPYACLKPAELHRLNGVFTDDGFSNPLKYYVDEGGYILSNYQTIYVQFVSTDFLTNTAEWPAYFRRLVAAQLAVDAGPAIEGANVSNAEKQYLKRRSEAMSTDGVQQPPRKLQQGSWTRSRRIGIDGTRDRP